jgi:hypothetical protein
MKKNVKLLCILLVFSFFTQVIVAVDFSATYSEVTNTTIQNITSFRFLKRSTTASGYPIACHVGTLTVRKTNNQTGTLYGLRLQRSGDFNDGAEFYMYSTEAYQSSNEFGAQLLATVTSGSSTTVQKMDHGVLDPFRPELTYFTSFPITIEFYLCIRNIPYGLAMNAGFQFQTNSGPNLGYFTLHTNNTAQTWWDPNGANQDQIDVNGSTGTIPFFSINYNKDSANYINKTVIQETVNAYFSISQTDSEKSLAIMDSSSTWPQKVGTANLTLEGNSSSTYGVDITFKDTNGGTGYNFLLKDETGTFSLPLNLYFNGEPVENAIKLTWDSLVVGTTSTKTISANPVSLTSAQQLPAGDYSDTVTVTISPIESNLSIY